MLVTDPAAQALRQASAPLILSVRQKSKHAVPQKTSVTRWTPKWWLFASVALVFLCAFFISQSRRGDFLYDGALGDSGLRYEVYSAKGIFGLGMPGDGSSGPALVVVYDSGVIVFQRNIQTALSEVTYFDGELSIAGEGAWKVEEIRNKK